MDIIELNIDEVMSNVNGLPFDVRLYYTEDTKHKYAFINRYKYYIRALRQVESEHIAELGALRDELVKFDGMKKGKIFKLERLNRHIRNYNYEQDPEAKMIDTGPLEKKRDETLSRLNILVQRINHTNSERTIVIQALKKVIAAKNSIKHLYQVFQTGIPTSELEEEDENESPNVIAQVTYRE